MLESVSRRHLLTLTSAAALAGCSGTRRNSAFWSTVTNTRMDAEGPAATRAYAEGLPYASMLFWLDGQAKSLIVLGSIDPGERLTWYTPDRQAITTFGPFVVATAGTDVELRRTEFGPGWSRDPRALIGRELSREIVVADRTEARARLRSTFHAAGRETVAILGRRLVLDRVTEIVVAEDRVRFANSYWIDPATGTTLKSRQQALPTLPPVNTEILKAPAA